MAIRKFHMCLSVRGALKWPLKDLADLFEGKSAGEAQDFLMDELSKGHEVFPIGDCDNFDYKKGCQGHR